MNTNPGWYPDPTGAPGQRYHDGHRWTDHFTPTPPPTANRKPLIALAVFGGFLLMGLVAQHPWLLIVLAVLGVLAGAGCWALKAAQGREVQQRREQFERDMLAQRADREDRLYQQGDPCDVHGQYLPPEFPR
ncbi:DUF2510 domain-containing protein [Mycolicibacterium sp. A43C]